jgi:hypothetical protein
MTARTPGIPGRDGFLTSAECGTHFPDGGLKSVKGFVRRYFRDSVGDIGSQALQGSKQMRGLSEDAHL